MKMGVGYLLGTLLGVTGVSHVLHGQAELVTLDPSVPDQVITGFSFLADPEDKWSPGDVIRPEIAADFQKYDPQNPGYDPEVSNYWIRLSVVHADSFDREWVFNFDGWSYVSFHTVEDDSIASGQRTGHLLPIAERDYPVANKNNILVLLRSGENQTSYIRLQSRPDHVIRPAGLSFRATLRSHYDRQASQNRQIISVFIGIYALMFLYNLFIYTSTRDKAYVFYLLHIIGLGYMTLNNAGYSVSMLGSVFDHFPQWRGLVESVVSAYNVVVAILFTIIFLHTSKYLPFWHKVLWYAIFGILIVLIGVNINFELFAPFVYLLMILILIVFVIVGIRSIRKGVPSAQYYLLAYIFSVSGTLVLALSLLGVLPLTEYILHYSLPTGYVLQMLFFSFALANRINILKQSNEENQKRIIEHLQENERLQLRVTEELEEKVAARTQEVVRQKEVIQAEKEKSENLLYNILPQTVARELIETGSTNPARYDDVSILFTDFVDFTQISASIPPSKLVNELNAIFYQFDDIIRETGLEKIKTIGDSYMAVAGLPVECEDHAIRCVRAAIAMLRQIEERNKVSSIKWGMRAGIHSGPVVAGVVGKHKFTFDLWGDTVNLASRMETAGEPGKINISAYTYDLIRNELHATYRGKISIKGKGDIDMYFVDADKAFQK